MTVPVGLDTYGLLGGSGLRVSPLCLGTMTFGEVWGADTETSRAIFDAYVGAGGNFIDTANMYSRGASEDLVGTFAQGQREKLVIATKFSFAMRPGDPNSGGNHRKSMVRSVEDSLRRLRTDYIDLLFLHAWDGTTPPEEIMRGLDDLVRQGKVVYCGISDTPAWRVSAMQVLAELRGWSPFIAMQAEYSLIQRTSERDLIPMAKDMGIGLLPWSPLAGGLLSGKYARGGAAADSARKAGMEAHGRITPRSLAIADAVADVAQAYGISSAQVALAWVLAQASAPVPVIGARTLAQYKDNSGALGLVLDPAHLATLNAASAIDKGFPHDFLDEEFIRSGLAAGTTIRRRS